MMQDHNVSAEGHAPAAPSEPARPDMSWVVVFFFVAVGMVAWGVHMAFSVSPVVGGDAYNYQIAAARGFVLVGAGIVAALIGVALTVHASARQP